MARPIGSGGGKSRLLKRDEILRIDKCLAGGRHEHRNRAILWMGFGTGMRISEIVGLRLGDILDEAGEIKEASVLNKHSTKSKRSRTVDISDEGLKPLRAWVGMLEEKHGAPLPRDLPLFGSQQRRHETMNAGYAVQLFKKMAMDAGISDVSSHSMRRTHGTALGECMPLKYVQEQLGHANISTTAGYFSVNPRRKREAIKKMKV